MAFKAGDPAPYKVQSQVQTKLSQRMDAQHLRQGLHAVTSYKTKPYSIRGNDTTFSYGQYLLCTLKRRTMSNLHIRDPLTAPDDPVISISEANIRTSFQCIKPQSALPRQYTWPSTEDVCGPNGWSIQGYVQPLASVVWDSQLLQMDFHLTSAQKKHGGLPQ